MKIFSGKESEERTDSAFYPGNCPAGSCGCVVFFKGMGGESLHSYPFEPWHSCAADYGDRYVAL